jgi:spermidine/putrescine transport system permease protein
MLAPLVLPEIVIAVSFLVLMVYFQVNLGYFTLITGHVVISLPFATLIVRATASGLDRTLEEAGADLGANAWQVFRRITLPLLMPGILAALLLTLTISFDTFVMSMFAAGVGTTTLPLRIFGMLKTGITPEINALGTILIGINLLLILAIGGRQLRQVMGGAGMG